MPGAGRPDPGRAKATLLHCLSLERRWWQAVPAHAMRSGCTSAAYVMAAMPTCLQAEHAQALEEQSRHAAATQAALQAQLAEVQAQLQEVRPAAESARQAAELAGIALSAAESTAAQLKVCSCTTQL